jgi:hypothetical protein
MRLLSLLLLQDRDIYQVDLGSYSPHQLERVSVSRTSNIGRRGTQRKEVVLEVTTRRTYSVLGKS